MDKSIIKSIISDKKMKENYARYLTRFIFMPLSKKSYYDITKISSDLNMKFKMLSECNNYPNTIITASDLLNYIQNEISKTTDDIIFLGLSEIIRLFNPKEFEATLKTIIEIENPSMNDRRIYFPIFSCFQKISEIVREYKEKNYYPILEIYTDITHYEIYEIYFYDESVSTCLKNSKDYYNIILYYGTGQISDRKIVCNSPQILKLIKNNKIINDNYFILNGFMSSEDVCKYYLTDFNINKNYIFTETEYNKLKSFIENRQISIKDLIKEKIGSFDEFSLINNMFIYGKEYNVLIWAYILNQINNPIYDFMKLVCKYSGKIENSEIIKSIFNIIMLKELNNHELYPNSSSIFNTRKKIINYLIEKNIINYKNYEFSVEYENILKDSYRFIIDSIYFDEGRIAIEMFDENISSQDINILKKYCYLKLLPSITSYSKFERQLIIWLFSNSIISIADIKEKYEDLYNYLIYDLNMYVDNEDVNEYFSEYRYSKLKAKASNDFNKIKNKFVMDDNLNDSFSKFNKWFKKIENRNVDNVDKVFVFDGVGYEYAGYILYLLSKYDSYSISLKLQKAKLPSITSINKTDLLSTAKLIKWYSDYDSKIIHDNFYKYYLNIEKALTLIKTMVTQVLSELKPGEKISITSDHGSTVQHKIFPTTKVYAFLNSEHDGRCCKITNDTVYDVNNSDYIVYKDFSTKEEWLLASGNVSLYNTSKYETHGGATLEEICIPTFEVFYDKSTNYSITCLNTTINSLNRKFSFIINPQPVVPVFIIEEDGKRVKCDFNNNVYSVMLSTGKTQSLIIKIVNKEFKIIIKSNSLNDEEDDFFI